ncbi:carboxypeptidase-like regulatory domain-containing protein [Anaerolinea sp.]|uniref:carboxypeptidase-like regulatory domain-containing protein n=1 Tax=Anaerolinea sp. TaxID=1872519 RepID=UPI002ACDDDB7|nr:carboxypeptidase-like regulatory domain-containing protein [Anaerolinea sp.]
MPQEQSPSLETYRQGLPVKKKGNSSTGRKRFRILLVGMAVIIVVLAAINFFQSPAAKTLAGTGSVQGIVVNKDGKPLNAEIFITGTKWQTSTNANGQFSLTLPAGNYSLVVARNGMGNEYPISVQRGKIQDLGTIVLVSTPSPGD